MQKRMYNICQHYKNRSAVQRRFKRLGWLKVFGMIYEYTDLRRSKDVVHNFIIILAPYVVQNMFTECQSDCPQQSLPG